MTHRTPDRHPHTAPAPLREVYLRLSGPPQIALFAPRAPHAARMRVIALLDGTVLGPGLAGIAIDSVLPLAWDAADRPGMALALLEAGARHVCCACPQAAFARLADIARRSGCRLSGAPDPVLNAAHAEKTEDIRGLLDRFAAAHRL